MLVDWQPNFENPENISQFPNLARNPNLIIRNWQKNYQNPLPSHPCPEANMAPAAQQFVKDPFKGNINPGTSEGAKLDLKATASIPDDDKFVINISSAQKFVDMVTKDATNFGWGALVRAIPSDDAGGVKNILVDHRDITLDMIKKQAYKTWGNYQANYATPVPKEQDLEVLDPAANAEQRVPFYCRVSSRMIAKRIIGYLKMSDWECWDMRNI